MKFLLILIFLLVDSYAIEQNKYNCRQYKNINILKVKNIKYINEDNLAKDILVSLGNIKIKVYYKNRLYIDFVSSLNNEIIKHLELESGVYSYILQKTLDNSIILSINKPYKVILYKIDKNGDILWSWIKEDKDFMPNNNYSLQDLIINKHNNIICIITNQISSYKNNYGYQSLLYKINASGETIWTRKLEIKKYDDRNIKLNSPLFKNNKLIIPDFFNFDSLIKEYNNCYLVENHILNLYNFYAIDDNGSFWTKDINKTKDFYNYVQGIKKNHKPLAINNYIVLSILFVFLYLLYKKLRKEHFKEKAN